MITKAKRKVFRFKGEDRIHKAYTALYARFPLVSTSGSTTLVFCHVGSKRVATMSEWTPEIYQLRLE